MTLAVIDGSLYYQWGDSAIVALVAICMVFLILLAIIGITFGIFKGMEAFKKKAPKKQDNNPSSSSEVKFDENNEDMVAAVMVATIDYQQEIKQDVKLVNIKEIK